MPRLSLNINSCCYHAYKGTPKNILANPQYEALIHEFMDYFRESIRLAVKSGIAEDKIIIDPDRFWKDS
jgi:dihydropteroate synthase